MELQQKYQPGLRMFPQVWLLLKMYTAIVNHKLKERGLKPKTQAAVLGAICSRFLLALQSRIIDEYKAIDALNAVTRSKANAATRAVATAYLSNITGAGDRAGDSATDATNKAAPTGPIRWNSWGPSPATRGLQSSSGKIRSRSNAAARTTGVWEHIARAAVPERPVGIELGGFRLQRTHRTKDRRSK